MSATFVELGDVGLPVRTACALIGRARATHYRHVRGPVLGPKPARVPARNAQALSMTERTVVLKLINTPTYGDHSIGQIYARELDEDRYARRIARRNHLPPEPTASRVPGLAWLRHRQWSPPRRRRTTVYLRGWFYERKRRGIGGSGCPSGVGSAPVPIEGVC